MLQMKTKGFGSYKTISGIRKLLDFGCMVNKRNPGDVRINILKK